MISSSEELRFACKSWKGVWAQRDIRLSRNWDHSWPGSQVQYADTTRQRLTVVSGPDGLFQDHAGSWKRTRKKKKCSPTSICVPSDIQGSTCIISKLLKTLRSNFHNTVHPLKLYDSMALVYLKVAQPPPLFNSSIFSSLQKVIPYPLYAPCSQPGATTNLNAGSIDFSLLCISRAIWGIL